MTRHIVSLLVSALACLTLLCGGAMGSDAVVTSGQASLAAYPETARERALLVALDNACAVKGIEIESQSIVDMGILIDDFIKTKTNAYVEHYEILEDGGRDGMWNVKVKAWVQKGAAREEADKAILSSHVVALFPSGKGSASLRDALAEKLASFGMSVVSDAALRAQFGNKYAAIASGDMTPGPEDMRFFLASYAVLVRSDVDPCGQAGNMEAFRANATIDLIDIRTGLSVFSSNESGRIFGKDLPQALSGGRRDQFPAAVVKPVVTDFLEKAGKEFNKRTRYVDIRIKGLASKEAFDSLRDVIKTLKWVDGIQDETYGAEESSMKVLFGEKTIYLAAMLEVRNAVSVKGYGWDWLSLTSRRDG